MTKQDWITKQKGRDERALQRLKKLRRWSTWTAEDARKILIGIHPGSTGASDFDSSYDYQPLPGTHRRYGFIKDGRKQSISCREFHHWFLEFEAQLSEYIHGDPQLPCFWIEKALSKRFKPPWFNLARALGLLEGTKAGSDGNAIDRQKGGQSTQRGSAQGKFKLVVIAAWDRQFADRKQLGASVLDDEISEFKKLYARHFLQLGKDTGERTVSGWVRQLRDNLFEGTELEWMRRYRQDPLYDKVKVQENIEAMMQSAELAASRSADNQRRL